jgi:hypothetical protein
MLRVNDVAVRIELLHKVRGKLTDLASGPGGVETAFRAIDQILGTNETLEKLNVAGSLRDNGEWHVSACVSVRFGSFEIPGWCTAPDALTASCGAYLDALGRAAECGIEKTVSS